MLRNSISFKKFTCPILTRFLHKEYKIHINGHKINFYQVGYGEKTLLLLPEVQGTAWTNFRAQIESLPELLPNYTIYAWDTPRKSKSPNCDAGIDSFHNDSKLAVNLMRALSRQKFSLMGWSSGAYTAIITAGLFPQYVDRLIIWGAGTHLNDDDIRAITDLNRTVMSSLLDVQPQSGEPLNNRRHFYELLPKCINSIIHLCKVRNGDFCPTQEDTLVKVPTFVLRGAHDPFWTVKDLLSLLSALPICKYYEFPDGNHDIHLRFPNEFNQIVAEFLVQNESEFHPVSIENIYARKQNCISSKFERSMKE